MDEKKESILKEGIFSPYWDEYARTLPWERESAETKLYLAGTLLGFPHEYALQVMREQSAKLGSNFRSMGFFFWKELFKNKRFESHNNVEGTKRVVIKVRDISLGDYERIVNSNREYFPEIFLENGEVDWEFLSAIHFNATATMGSADVEVGDDLEGFVYGALVGCIGTGKESVLVANQDIRRDS